MGLHCAAHDDTVFWLDMLMATYRWVARACIVGADFGFAGFGFHSIVGATTLL